MQTPSSPNESQWTILKTLQWTTSYFKSNHIDSPRLTIEILLAHVLGINRIDLYTDFDRPLNPEELSGLKSLIKRRINREPVAYITGHKEFYGIDFIVSKDVLIPRPETEFVVEEALNYLSETGRLSPVRIFDLGTGSGAIIVSLAVNSPKHKFFATDISLPALMIATANAKKNAVKNISFFSGDAFTALNHQNIKFDIIVSNPPYIPHDQIENLEPEIKDYEPVAALDGGPDGMSEIRRLIRSAPVLMNQGAVMLVEIGFDQRVMVETEIDRTPSLTLVKFIPDYAGHDRVAVMRKIK